MTKSRQQIAFDQIIEDEFGINADYVIGLLEQFEQNPASVGEEWRDYFYELTGAAEPAPAEQATAPAEAAQPAERPAAQPAPGAASEPSAQPVQPRAAEAADRLPLRGAALKIAENMEASLQVPTATSQRQIPLKLLDENRRLLNEHLKASNRKVSYTHLIARAITRAVEQYPALNDAYEAADGQSYRIRRSDVNLGIAVDVTRKDGTRTLLVPNIKGADKLTFPDLLSAYDDIVSRARAGKLQISDFQDTTISLTNPGTIGTTASNPRLMAGQGA
ncbi:MAG TPA: 2-oxo acid dehydrogenase subunit E2, partial [Blastocatellia bacterium]|nr:2-oxo acid dehydrogenase subunit E2 [Blastocatellia bacterium]